ncbi:hypothetical protein CTA1_5953 [Colletotrichum tanaceti]|uniref:Uncharacterized protein n=1 Tax=Colletotrichum tanaceti TaxID=1306861 RepID=A0A4U6XB16_9PEZI|nr:hypothetical protein CTA1_5953 [Colletotrichum tanaceti]
MLWSERGILDAMDMIPTRPAARPLVLVLARVVFEEWTGEFRPVCPVFMNLGKLCPRRKVFVVVVVVVVVTVVIDILVIRLIISIR